MKLRFIAKPLVAAVLAAGLLFSGCGGGSGAATKVTVSMSPGNGSTVNLFVNQTYQFTAQAVGSTDQSVTFALSYILASNASATPAPTPTPCVTAPTPSTNPNCGTLSAITTTSTTTTSGTTTVTNTWYSVTYTAPALVSSPAVIIYLTATATADTTATAKATVNIDSGIRVTVTPSTATIGTGETFPFTATLTNDSTNSVTWSLQQAGQVTTTAGSIAANGVYTAPAAVPTTPTVTIVATSVKDPTRQGTATVTIVNAVPATFSGIAPAIGATPVVAPQGALFHDIYLLAGNLRSTSTVQITDATNTSVPVLNGQLKIINTSLARLRLNSANLQTAQILTISVLSATPPVNPVLSQVSVVPVRPALIASLPDSVTIGTNNNSSVQFNGGYFGPSGSVVSALLNGSGTPQTITTATSTPRQLYMTPAAGSLGADGPGLYQTSVLNGAATPSLVVTNIAAQPDPGVTPPSFLGTCVLCVTTAPVAIAEDTTTGTAVVVNSGDNSIERITIGQGLLTPVDTLPVPMGGTYSPTSVAVDESQHIAAVAAVDPANPAANARVLKIFDLATAPVTTLTLVADRTLGWKGTIDLTAATTANPVAVALDPDRKLGLVAFASTSIGLIFNTDPLATPACLTDLGTSPYCVIGAVNISTGANPQIAFHPRLHWAFVTPGGAGQMSVVDMAEPRTNVGISAIKRVSSLVTVTTSANHNIDPANLPTVLISGLTDVSGIPSFNGTFTVTAVLDATTFTYAQVEPDATSSGGTVSYSRPLMTFSISPSIRGIAINPQTDRAVLTDGNNNFASFVSMLDQTTTGLSLHPATGAAYQPFTNVAVVVKPGPLGTNSNDLITLINPGTPGVFTAPPTQLAEIITGGTGSVAVVVDPPTNQALVVNTTSNNVSLIALGGSMKLPQISRIEIVDPTRKIFSQGTFYDPAAAAAPALSVKIFGAGLGGTPTVRLDGVGLTPVAAVSSREIDISIPASFLTSPRRYALDVVQSGAYSNAADFSVVAAVNIAGTGCLTPQPTGVAIDDVRDLAIVSNIGCNNVSVINLSTGQIAGTVPVGTAPAGVATIPRLGYAVVANSDLNLTDGSSLGTGSVSIVNLATNAIISGGSVNVGTAPTGVAINQDSGKAYIVNTLSNTMSVIDLTATTPAALNVGVDQRPISIAVDPERNVALVGAIQQSGSSSQGVLDVMDISGATPTTKSRISAFTSMPAGIAFDPSDSATPGNNLFYAVSSLSNALIMANPDTGGAQSVRIGVNPTSVAYNFQTGTLITRNTMSNTLSFVDMQSLRTRAVISLGAPQVNATSVVLPQYAVAIHPRTNLAVVTDAAGGRVLLLPMPR
ncbi:MAG: YncE family protein [Acidobacteriia bacterium]|nr:YncE family protein [Terriglobia bacterium]